MKQWQCLHLVWSWGLWDWTSSSTGALCILLPAVSFWLSPLWMNWGSKWALHPFILSIPKCIQITSKLKVVVFEIQPLCRLLVYTSHEVPFNPNSIYFNFLIDENRFLFTIKANFLYAIIKKHTVHTYREII